VKHRYREIFVDDRQKRQSSLNNGVPAGPKRGNPRLVPPDFRPVSASTILSNNAIFPTHGRHYCAKSATTAVMARDCRAQ